ncbi:MAG: hypothetical protein KKC03_13275 [Bacteroidetes bacterium]|nr:hypothetical protein [Bacteroidota bacterium]
MDEFMRGFQDALEEGVEKSSGGAARVGQAIASALQKTRASEAQLKPMGNLRSWADVKAGEAYDKRTKKRYRR